MEGRSKELRERLQGEYLVGGEADRGRGEW